MKRIVVLGSTGSIGTQTLDVARRHADKLEVVALAAGTRAEELLAQAREFGVHHLAVGDGRLAGEPVADELAAQARGGAQPATDAPSSLAEAVARRSAAGEGSLGFGAQAVDDLVRLPEADIVVNALVGAAGLRASYETLRAGKVLALANKESLVVGGACVMPLARERKAPVIPIDSEHSAIFQCLVGERAPVRRLIVTCSGGAFRDFRAEELANVTVEQALRHPQWDMGAKITIDSSTLVNKGFEVIEAHWLFGTPAERISVLLHPQSIIHSMVEFEDGAIKAQLGTPDMRLPISFALLYPDRANRPGERFNFLNHPQLTFAEVDRAKYPALDIAYDCLRRGGTAACTMNGANEVAVAAFLARKCAWLDIVRAIRYALEHAAFVPSPTLADYAEANAEARALAAEFLQLKN